MQQVTWGATQDSGPPSKSALNGSDGTYGGIGEEVGCWPMVASKCIRKSITHPQVVDSRSGLVGTSTPRAAHLLHLLTNRVAAWLPAHLQV